jgi:MFS family permease
VDPRQYFRRNLGVLIALYSLSSIGSVTLATVASLAGLAFSPDPKWATLPVSAYVVGGALSTYAASALMGRLGRRRGFRAGAAIGVVGALTGAQACQLGHFWLLVLSSLLLGTYAAFGQYYRFAASEAAPPDKRARAVSWVLTGGIAGAILGPESARLTRDLVGASFVGCYLTLAALAALAFLTMGQLILPPLVEQEEHLEPGPRSEGRFTPNVLVAVLAAVVGYAVMLFLMTATPIAMSHHHHHFDSTARVIEWHVLGMFVPSFFTGSLITRIGVGRVVGIGIGLMLACGVINLLGTDFIHFWAALVLLGVGWNFMFIGGTTLLTESVRASERQRVLGINETCIHGSNAIASLSAGYLLYHVGWQAMNLAALPFLMLVVVALSYRYFRTTALGPKRPPEKEVEAQSLGPSAKQ